MRIFLIYLLMVNSLSAERLIKAAVGLWSFTNTSRFGKSLKPMLRWIHNYLNYNNILNLFTNKKLLVNFSEYEDCFEDITYIVKSTQSNALDSLKWIDSSAKVPTGLMGGAMSWHGNSAECLNNYWIEPNYSTFRRIVPQYCVSKISIPPEPRVLSLKIGYCLPKKCNQSHIVSVINSFLKETFPDASNYISCQSKTDQSLYDGWFIIALTICILLAIFVLAATFWEIFIYHKWKFLERRLYIPGDVNSTPTDVNLEEHSEETEEDTASLLSKKENKIPFNEYRHQYVASHGSSSNLLLFSVVENTRRLFELKSASDGSENASKLLACLHGIRSITMMWIVLGHVVIMSLLYSNNPLFYLKEQSQKWTFQAMIGATVSVDTFFFMSGLLTTFFSLPKFSQCNSFKKRTAYWIAFVVRRFLRLTPLLLCITILYVGLYPHVSDGQVKSVVTELDMVACREHWWVSYLNNFFYKDDMKNSIRKNACLSIICFSISGATMLAVVYGLYGVISGSVPQLSLQTSAAYNSLIRPAWAMALAVIVFLCVNGLADPVNAFLSADVFIPIGRLTYAIYLVHPIVIAYVLESSQQAVLMDDVFVAVYFIACFVLSSMLGYILSMAVESPLLALSNRQLKK